MSLTFNISFAGDSYVGLEAANVGLGAAGVGFRGQKYGVHGRRALPPSLEQVQSNLFLQVQWTMYLVQIQETKYFVWVQDTY